MAYIWPHVYLPKRKFPAFSGSRACKAAVSSSTIGRILVQTKKIDILRKLPLRTAMMYKILMHGINKIMLTKNSENHVQRKSLAR